MTATERQHEQIQRTDVDAAFRGSATYRSLGEQELSPAEERFERGRRTVGLFLAPAVVRFRDLRYVIPVGLQLLLLASPVGYPLSAVPADLRHWYQLNPFAGLLESFRAMALDGELPRLAACLPAVAWAAALLALGALYFRSQEATLADYV